MITVVPFLIFEFIAEIVMASIWYNNDLSACPVILVSEFIYFIPDIVTIIVLVVYKCRNRMTTRCFDRLVKIALLFDYEESHDHIPFVWIAALFGYHIMYSFFPLFILAFAYPTKIISMILFMIAFMVSFTAFAIIFAHKIGLKKDTKGKFKSTVIGMIFMVFLLYFFGILVALTYALVVGKASVVSSAPLAILSILPSLIIGSILWVLKNLVFGKSDNATDSVNGATEEDLKPTGSNGHDNIKLKDHGAHTLPTPSEKTKLIN